MSTESITSEAARTGAAERCASCGAPLAADQRYCLECGERRAGTSSVLSSAAPFAAAAEPAPAPAPPAPPGPPPPPLREASWQRSGVLTVIAGVGVLLLAMGVGVLIGRAGAGKSANAGTPVVTIAGGGSTSTGAPTAGEQTVASDWPPGTKGWTVQLQALPTSSAASAVEAAKSAASAKGAKAVGVLKSDEFSSLPAGSYIVYSGVYHKRSQAQAALPALKRSFPGAKVIEVAAAGAASGGGAASEPTVMQPGGTGESINKPAPPSALNGLHNAKGKSYVEKAKNLPNVVSTG